MFRRQVWLGPYSHVSVTAWFRLRTKLTKTVSVGLCWECMRCIRPSTLQSVRTVDPTEYAVTSWLAVWLSGNALASINVVALRQTQLVLGWVTVCGRVNHFCM